MEQQAQIIENYARITLLHIAPKPGRLQNKETGETLKNLFNSVLANFISNSSKLN